MPNPYDPAVDAVSRGMLDPSVLTPAQRAIMEAVPLARPAFRSLPDSFSPGQAPQALPIDLVEPDALAPAGDRLPCHLFAEEVDWPTAPEVVLRKDRAPAGSLLDALGPWLEADLDPVLVSPPWSVREFEANREALAAAKVRHRRLTGRLFLAIALGWLGMGLLLLALP